MLDFETLVKHRMDKNIAGRPIAGIEGEVARGEVEQAFCEIIQKYKLEDQIFQKLELCSLCRAPSRLRAQRGLHSGS